MVAKSTFPTDLTLSRLRGDGKTVAVSVASAVGECEGGAVLSVGCSGQDEEEDSEEVFGDNCPL